MSLAGERPNTSAGRSNHALPEELVFSASSRLETPERIFHDIQKKNMAHAIFIFVLPSKTMYFIFRTTYEQPR